MPDKARRALAPLGKDGAAESLHRFDVMGVEILVLHIAVETANVIALRHQRRACGFVIAKMARHQNDGTASRTRLFQRLHAGPGGGIGGHTFGKVVGGVVLDKGAADIVQAALCDLLTPGQRHVRPNELKVAHGAFAVARNRANSILYQPSDKAQPGRIGQGERQPDHPNDQQIDDKVSAFARRGLMRMV